jgi:hypothetical protein
LKGDAKWQTLFCCVGIDAVTAVAVKSFVFTDVIAYSPVKVNLHIMLGLLFYSEDGSNMFLRNVG